MQAPKTSGTGSSGRDEGPSWEAMLRGRGGPCETRRHSSVRVVSRVGPGMPSDSTKYEFWQRTAGSAAAVAKLMKP